MFRNAEYPSEKKREEKLKNIKFAAGFSIFGFVLSFIFGLFSRPFVFFHTFLIALIFAVVFACLGMGLQILFDKVLDFQSQEDGFAPQGAASVSSGAPVGQNVNIVIEDEDIPQTEGESDFFVGTNHQMLNDEDVLSDEKKNGPEDSVVEKRRESAAAVEKASEPIFKAQGLVQSADNILTTNLGAASSDPASAMREKIASENSSSSGFVPISLGCETPKNISGTEARNINEVTSNSSSGQTSGTNSANNTAAVQDDSAELDVLPDMDEITSSGQKKLSEDSEELPSDDEGFTPSGSSKDASEVTEGKDAALMAKAISTLLSQDK